jgi:outer membrane protein TolC
VSLAGLLLATAAGAQAPAPEPPATPLLLDEVIQSVVSRYPPLLAALIEQDVAAGRLRQAEGAFDLGLNGNVTGTPSGYYDGRTGSLLVEQALQGWGARVFGGYRLSSGFLPNYNLNRTPPDGQVVAGVRLSLLRDGNIDRARASLSQARIAETAVDPQIGRARLDFVRSATVAYYQWLAAGLRLTAAEALLRVARERDAAIETLVKKGSIAPIVRTDNERLVISRRLALTQAQRRFEAHAIELSLFLRDRGDRPVLATRARLPAAFPRADAHENLRPDRDEPEARRRRPELRTIALSIERLEVERRLVRADTLPSLDVALEARQSPTGQRLPDIEATETRAAVELRVPLQRREAGGRLMVVDAQIRQARQEEQFLRDRVVAELRDAHSALTAAAAQLDQARRNVELADQLEEAERLRFRQGATDLLALQIREQASFDARLAELDTQLEYGRALAAYRAAAAVELAR